MPLRSLVAAFRTSDDVRQLEARQLMLNENLDAGSAAMHVGYESDSQFSREYSRLFGAPPLRPPSMKAERYFYSTAALVMLAITFAGFQPYYLAGEGMSGRHIAPELFTPVLVHAIALTGWMVLFLVQALLIDVRSRHVHKRIGGAVPPWRSASPSADGSWRFSPSGRRRTFRSGGWPTGSSC
jgi:hypothetical protein